MLGDMNLNRFTRYYFGPLIMEVPRFLQNLLSPENGTIQMELLKEKYHVQSNPYPFACLMWQITKSH